MSRTARIGAAAAAVNRSATTLRRWEAEGRLTPTRDDAGHRVYDLAELRAVAAGDPVPATGAGRPSGASAASARAVQPFLAELDWDEGDEDEAPAPVARRVPADEAGRRVRAARADVEVARARGELHTLTNERDRAERDARTRAAAELAERTERARLGELRALGRAHATTLGAPAEWIAEVTADLSGYVTGARFPDDVDPDEAAATVRARVERRLRPWRERQERARERDAREQERARQDEVRERERAERRARVAALIRHGEQWATMTLLIGWHPRDSAKAIREVQAALADSVRHDWTEAEVRELVREVLDEWE